MQLAAELDAVAVGARLVHYTNAAAPLAARLPYVLTVHDLSVARMPWTHPLARWPIVPINLVAMARARAVIVPSRFTARELGRIGVSQRRVVVIPHAAAIDQAAAAPGTAVLARLGLEARRYILYFGTVEPRKNIERLVGAFERLAAVEPDLKLVLAGARGWRSDGIDRRIADSPARSLISLTGYLPDDELGELIRESGAVAYVSLYEGFGMPVLDAMAIGAAVVTSRTTAMPDAAGGAAVLVDPRDETDIANGIVRALAQHDDLVQRGRERAGRRTWADVAGQHRDVYRHALREL
jgi:glycosyltransferase involved in cell wall biosynthesis